MATKKAGGSTENGRDSRSKRLGLKRHGGEAVTAGEVLVRQKGSTYRAGENTYVAKDWTIHSRIAGKIAFKTSKIRKFNNRREIETTISVVPA
jgi:large subunit ribosomal protein L27